MPPERTMVAVVARILRSRPPRSGSAAERPAAAARRRDAGRTARRRCWRMCRLESVWQCNAERQRRAEWQRRARAWRRRPD